MSLGVFAECEQHGLSRRLEETREQLMDARAEVDRLRRLARAGVALRDEDLALLAGILAHDYARPAARPSP